jgi:hypothetical protein
MPTPMRPAPLLAVLAALALPALGCGNEIGDSCTLSSDCSPEGDRVCDTSSPGGYCTVIGCDFDSCPDGSICVRFFAEIETNLPCDPATEDHGTDDCTADEICTLQGFCVPSNAETRFCMKTCGSDGDCRDGYDCRDKQLMIDNGGEPVPEPGQVLSDDPQPFCAASPLSI